MRQMARRMSYGRLELILSWRMWILFPKQLTWIWEKTIEWHIRIWKPYPSESSTNRKLSYFHSGYFFLTIPILGEELGFTLSIESQMLALEHKLRTRFSGIFYILEKHAGWMELFHFLEISGRIKTGQRDYIERWSLVSALPFSSYWPTVFSSGNCRCDKIYYIGYL